MNNENSIKIKNCVFNSFIIILTIIFVYVLVKKIDIFNNSYFLVLSLILFLWLNAIIISWKIENMCNDEKNGGNPILVRKLSNAILLIIISILIIIILLIIKVLFFGVV